MNSYHSRLRQLAATCECTAVDKEIKSQISQSCTSQRLRRKVLKDSTMTLEALLAEARALEISEQQATEIESPGTANAVLPPKAETPDKTACCFNCGGSWPHDAKAACSESKVQFLQKIWPLCAVLSKFSKGSIWWRRRNTSKRKQEMRTSTYQASSNC